MFSPSSIAVFGAIVLVFEIIGVVSAVRAIFTARTSQASIAWTIALITWPILAVPLYWIFGRSKFVGYVSARRERNLKMLGIKDDIEPDTQMFRVALGDTLGDARVLEQIGLLPFTNKNDTELLIHGDATFKAIFEGIDSAEDYILAEFFIINDDNLGREFQQRLIRKAREDVAVYLLYDDVGSTKITRRYLAELREAGVQVSGMKTTRGLRNRFQLNFRNHRKIVVIDGKVAYVGGLNVGDEYVGRHKKLHPWRDTHMKIEGPAALASQVAFVEDWHWATQSVPDIGWKLHPSPSGDRVVFVLPSGPADKYETCSLFFTHAINSAKHRIWIASPYFVPDEGIVRSLQLAAMRGVDVRVIIPGLPDKWFIKQAAMSYVDEVTEAGVKMYEYGDGFMHQKVVLIDDHVSKIGTANFDNRSFRLNFEISVVIIDEDFAKQVEKMFIKDIDTSTLITQEALAARPLRQKLAGRVARLFAPIL